MTDIVFSEINIKSLINSNINTDLLLEQFKRKDLISKARYVDSVGLPWGSWKQVSKSIDAFLLSKEWIFLESNPIYNSNVAYFAPSSFINLGLIRVSNILNNFTQQQLNQVLSQKIIVDYIYKELIGKSNEFLLNTMNNNLFISLLFSFTQTSVFSNEIEIILIKKYLSVKNDLLDSFSRYFLETRLNAISQLKVKKPTDKEYKIALLICGQLRGFEYSLPKFASKFSNLGAVDTYISTWEDIGSTRFNLQSAYRIFDEESCDYIYTNKDSLDLKQFNTAIYQYKKKTFSKNVVESFLLENLSWCNNVHINIKNDKEYPYNKMSNPEKMYYHNSFWVETLGSNSFDKYDLIIKIRPDYLFKNEEPIIDLKSLVEDRLILVDASNYLFQEWGFGMGDQLWIGSPESILPILTCHNRNSLSYKYMLSFYSSKEYLGHVNCGIEAWLNGLNILSTPSSMLKSRLANTELIPFEEFKKMDLYK